MFVGAAARCCNQMPNFHKHSQSFLINLDFEVIAFYMSLKKIFSWLFCFNFICVMLSQSRNWLNFYTDEHLLEHSALLIHFSVKHLAVIHLLKQNTLLTLSRNSGSRIGSIMVHNIPKKTASNRDTTMFKLDKIRLKGDESSSVFPMVPTATNIKHVVNTIRNNPTNAVHLGVCACYCSIHVGICLSHSMGHKTLTTIYWHACYILRSVLVLDFTALSLVNHQRWTA